MGSKAQKYIFGFYLALRAFIEGKTITRTKNIIIGLFPLIYKFIDSLSKTPAVLLDR
jgi:hypothetical protein